MTPEAKAARKAVTPNEPNPWVALGAAAITAAFGLLMVDAPDADFIGMFALGTALLWVVIYAFESVAYKAGFKDGCECCRSKVGNDD